MNPSSVLPESFYRIIDEAVLDHQKLKLPEEFAEKYGGEVVNFVKVTVPVGDTWRLGVERSGKVFLLHDGLEKFMEHYSVGLGDLFLFKYKGSSKFDVNIFDLTATEVEYRSIINGTRRTNHTSAKTGYGKEKAGFENDEFWVDADVLRASKAKKAQGGKVRASVAATSNRVNTSSFKQTMKAYNVKTSFVLTLPYWFTKENQLNDVENAILQDSKGEEWPVRFIRQYGKVKWLSKGWKKFVEDKELVKGDVCVFELIQGDETIFNVTINPPLN